MSPARPLRKTRTVRSLRENPDSPQEFTDLFRLAAKTLATSSRGNPYLRLTLEDRTGTIEAFVWDDAERLNAEVAPGDVVEVSGRPKVHRGTPQVQVLWARRLTDEERAQVDPADLREGLDRDARDRNWTAIRELVDELENEPLRGLLRGFIDDPTFRRRFSDARAAKAFHHAYDGGLAEHTLTLMRLARAVAALYPGRIDRDLLVAGAFLHDVAKVAEFDPDTGEYTDAGRLVGHITLGVRMLDERIAGLPGFPEALRLQLAHLILAHHERAEWGSPVRPQTVEAIALHFLDNLDAKVNGAWAWLEKEAVEPGEWSGYWRGMETALMRTPAPTGQTHPQADDAPGGLAEVERALLEKEERERLPSDRETGDGRPHPRQAALFE